MWPPLGGFVAPTRDERAATGPVEAHVEGLLADKSTWQEFNRRGFLRVPIADHL